MAWAKGLFALLCLIGAVLPQPKAFANSDIILLTLEWPPYTGSALPDKGFVSKQIKRAYTSVHQNLQIGVFDWRQAVRLPYTDRRFAGTFPVYPSKERKKVCHLSDPVGVSEVGFAQRKQTVLNWRKVEDLTRYRIGVVDSYANEDTFDRLVQDKKITTVVSHTDTDNLLNLLKKQADAVVIDAQVFKWLMQNDKRLKPYRNQLKMNERLLVTWPLHVCFRKDAEGAKQRDLLNSGLMKQHDFGMMHSITPPRAPVPRKSIKPQREAA